MTVRFLAIGGIICARNAHLAGAAPVGWALVYACTRALSSRPMTDIYDSAYVIDLFDEMSGSYEHVNYISSFGFTKRWRRQFVVNAALAPGMIVYDFMCGMGESWGAIVKSIGDGGRVVALDFSEGMLRHARKRQAGMRGTEVALSRQNVLANELADASADAVICGFGIKTLSDPDKDLLAREIKRVLKPGGTFSLIEVSVPGRWFFRPLYMFYLKNVIPIIGRILLGNPRNYRMLGIYAERFGDCSGMRDILADNGLEVAYHDYFFGCATGVSGRKSATGQ